jgi:hypothetical protein
VISAHARQRQTPLFTYAATDNNPVAWAIKQLQLLGYKRLVISRKIFRQRLIQPATTALLPSKKSPVAILVAIFQDCA